MADNNNNKKTDHLREDPPFTIQTPRAKFSPTWVCVSFVSPDDMIKKRFIFEANRFLYHDVNKQIMDTTAQVVTDINRAFEKSLGKKIESYASSKNEVYKAAAEILKDVKSAVQLNEEDFVTKVLRTYRIDEQELLDRFEVYKMGNNKELEADFDKENNNATSVRGFKVRGCYEDLLDAKARCKMLRDEIEPSISVYTIPLGYWCPWDPNPDSVQDQDYMLPELNDLMGKYQRNVEQRNEFYHKRKQMMIDDANSSRTDKLRERLRQKVIQKQNQRIKKQINTTDEPSDQEQNNAQQPKGKNNRRNRNRRNKKKNQDVTQPDVTKNDRDKQLTFEVKK